MKAEGHKLNEEEMQGLAITTNCRMDALLTERFRWPQSLQLLDSLSKTLPIPGRHRQTTAAAASSTDHIRPDMGPNTCSRTDSKHAEGVREGKGKGRPQSRGRPLRKPAKSMTDTSKHNRHENLAGKKKMAKKSKLVKYKRDPKTQQNIF